MNIVSRTRESYVYFYYVDCILFGSDKCFVLPGLECGNYHFVNSELSNGLDYSLFYMKLATVQRSCRAVGGGACYHHMSCQVTHGDRTPQQSVFLKRLSDGYLSRHSALSHSTLSSRALFQRSNNGYAWNAKLLVPNINICL